MNPSPIALGIDFGEARIGVAATDPLGMLAHPVETIDTRRTPDPAARIAEIAKTRGASIVVVGLPLRMDGTEGTAAAKVRTFATVLESKLPAGTRIVFIDERLSTVQAHETLRAAGRSTRHHRPVVDQVAATVILQDWLDQQSPPMIP